MDTSENDRLHDTRLAEECAKLDPTCEQAMTEEMMSEELVEWPQY